MPNPCVREYARSKYGSYILEGDEKTTVSVCQVLFKGHQNELFMIFNDGSIDPVTFEPANKLKWKLGILNLKSSHERVDNVRN